MVTKDLYINIKMIKITDEQWEKIFSLRDSLFESVYKHEFMNYQKRLSNAIIKSIIENRGLTLSTEISRQSGKTSGVVATVGFLLLFFYQICKQFEIPTTPQFNVGFFAPQERQAQSAFMMLRDFLRKCEKQGFDFNFDSFNGDTIMMRSSNYPPRTVYCMTASPTSRQESKTLNLIIIDEAQDIEDKVVDRSISPMGASTNATEIWIGVGGYRRCKFQKFIDELPDDQKVIAPYDVILQERREKYEKTGNILYLNYEKHIKKRRLEIGEDSDEFKTQYKLIWILERGQFITYEELFKLEEEYDANKILLERREVYGGIDWGKSKDSTVFTVISYDYKVLDWFEWQGDDYASQIEEIEQIIRSKYSTMRVIHCDTTGTQDMAVDILQKRVALLGIQVEGINFNPVSKDEMYKNLSRMMHDRILGGQILEPAVLRFPKRDSLNKNKFAKQMLDLQKEIRNEKWRCQHPDGAGYHDDYPTSIALACLAFAPTRNIYTYSPTIA